MNKRNILIITGFLILAIPFGLRTALASPKPAPFQQASPLHPTFALLDSNGDNVLDTGNPVSTMQTCGQCHDTEFIQKHAIHSDLGLSDYTATSHLNASTGTFGKWDPLTYRFLSQKGDERLDLGTPAWLMLYGNRVVGGGPATTSRNGEALTDLQSRKDNPETSILNENDITSTWDWKSSGTMEMNCFLCHLENPNIQTRKDFISVGGFEYARE